MYTPRPAVLSTLLGLFLLCFSEASAGSFIYPFDQIASPNCRFSAWSTLGNECKMAVPRIVGADYQKYKDDKMLRRVYSVLWWATYDYGWDVWYGSHEGVDIATSAGTPVRAIGDGQVVIAGWLSGWGNTVSIKHKLADGRYVWSNYAHLSKIIAKKGSIKAGETIGEVGNTGNSYGNHLHFEIDITDQAHPYYFSTCAKGKDPLAVVNQWLCRNYLTANTIDPIAFLESDGSFTTIEKIQEMSKATPKIEKKSIKSREQILDEEIEDFLKNHTLSVKIGIVANNVEIGKTYTARIFVNEYNRPFTGSLPAEGLELNYDASGLKVFPEKIIAIEGGVREFQITGKKTGKYAVSFKIGKKIFLVTTINVFSPNEVKSPTNSVIIANKSIILGDERLSAVVFRTKYGSNQIDIPYAGRYILRSVTGKTKFCNVSNKLPRKCNPADLVESLEFGYEDTYRWVLLTNIIPLDYMPVSLKLTRMSDNRTVGNTHEDIVIRNPNSLDKTYVYFSEAIAALKKGLFRLTSGYLLQDRELIGKQAKEIIQNYGAHLFLSAGDNLVLKKQIVASIQDFGVQIHAIDNYKKVTRWEFAKLLLDSIDVPLEKNTDKKWTDEAGEYKDVITTLRTRYGFAWKDAFGERYFQANKIITIWEALYLVESVWQR